MSKKDFQVSIMHGHAKEYLKVKKYIQELKFTPRILIEEYNADCIFAVLRNLIWDDIHCVVVILTCDDTTIDHKQRARQNVVFELGYCFGAFDSLPENSDYLASDAIIILVEKGVELFADINGLTVIYFEKNKLHKIKPNFIRAVQLTYKKAKEFYEL